MSPSRLTPFQERVLAELAGNPAGWTLTGGAALAGFHTRHRATRDLDLFWHERSDLGDLRRDVEARLRAAGFSVETASTSPHHVRCLVRSGDDQLVIDLVADPVRPIEEPTLHDMGGRLILVDTAREILVNKLTTLIQRTELRDLVDVGALLEKGLDLDRALAEAPRKDRGFSPLTLAWLLREMPVETMARAEGASPDLVKARVELRDRLLRRVLELVALDQGGAPNSR
ncbi:MAG: nucleotidyl transferase AbiEii/AbiGii toxin family protein [Planctomycetota bacterium]|nr:nucleotidyl transferase AbiEii/AbiGii toxin family protein [Planctomycetota bacterium]